MELTLQELIPIYAQNKLDFDSYKKICDTENAQIKQLMAQEGKTEETSCGWTVKYSVQVKESINEAALLEYAHKHRTLKSIIKTKEYIDFDALENAIYNGLISREVISDINRFRETKEVPMLRITKAKEK